MPRKSRPEAVQLKEALEGLGIYVVAEAIDDERVDLTLPAARMNIEIDRSDHLTDPYQILKDVRRSHYSDGKKYGILHIHAEEIRSRLKRIAVAIAEAAKIQEARLAGKRGWAELS
jgi:very-short-patch-repair endonuclease